MSSVRSSRFCHVLFVFPTNEKERETEPQSSKEMGTVVRHHTEDLFVGHNHFKTTLTKKSLHLLCHGGSFCVQGLPCNVCNCSTGCCPSVFFLKCRKQNLSVMCCSSWAKIQVAMFGSGSTEGPSPWINHQSTFCHSFCFLNFSQKDNAQWQTHTQMCLL